MNIVGKIKVKAKINDNGSVSYRTSVTGKDVNGKAIFYTMFIRLVQNAKDKPIDNDSYIDIKKSFLSPMKIKDETSLVLVVQEFEYCDNTNQAKTNLSNFKVSNASDDLPF